MTKESLLGPWVRRFIMECLPHDRNLAGNTQRSYRDMFCLLIPFAAQKLHRAVDKLTVVDISVDLVRDFFKYLQEVRNCGVITCNQRLAAIHAMASFVGTRSPEHLEWCSEIKTIPFKRSVRTLINYLEKSEMDAMLAAADQSKPQGRRDYALLLFLYNSGARCDEATQLTVADLHYTPSKWDNGYVVLHGKGGKVRRCPLWSTTIQTLHPLVVNRKPEEHVFMNRHNVPIQRHGIYDVVKRHGRRAAVNVPSIATKRISPHIIRHSTACHLLKSGVDINTIRDWLGHASLNTTNIYARIDLETKAKALAKCEMTAEPSNEKHWRDQPELMDFLRNL